MFITGFMIGIYTLIAALAAVLTYYEQRDREDPSVLYSALGFLACLFWPLTLMTVLVAARTSLRTARTA